MKTRFIFSLCFIMLLSSFFPSNAQQIKITGQITDNQLNRIKGASLVLVNKTDSSVMCSSVSEEDGSYNLMSHRRGPAALYVSHISYKTQSMEIPAVCDSVIFITLDEEKYSMGEVTVSGKRQTISYNESGNMVVALENLKGYESQTVSEIMKKIPGITVMADGSILLYGQAVTFQMDGKNLKSADNILKSLPAEALRELVIVSDPTAQYESSSTSVINIVTNRKKENGYTLNATIGGMLNTKMMFEPSGSIFVKAKIKNFYINNTVIYEAYPFMGNNTGTTTFKTTGKELVSTGWGTERSRRIMDNLNLTWVLKHNQEISANAYIFLGHELRNYEKTETFTGEEPKRYESNDKPIISLISANVSYKTGENLPFKLETSYGAVYFKYDKRENMNVTQSDREYLKYINKMGTVSLQHIVKADYSQKFLNDKLSLAAGIRGEITPIKGFDKNDVLAGEAQFDNIEFDGNEKIGGIYAGLSYLPNDKWTFYIGGRAEYTDYDLNVKSTAETSHNSYWNAVPYATISYKPSKAYKGAIRLSGNISRPSFDYMMPGDSYVSEYEYEKGNPYLKPRTEYSIGLTNTFFDLVYLNIWGNYAKNNIMAISIEKENGVTEQTYDNCVDQRDIAAWIGTPFSFFDASLTGQFGIDGRYGTYFNPHNGYNLLPERKNYYRANMSLYIDYEITPRLDINAYAIYNIISKTLQTDAKGYATLDLNIRYSFLKDKNLTVSFSASDIFNSYRDISTSYYDNIVRHNNYKYTSQYFTLSISYRFSGGQKINRRESYDPNDTERFF